MALSFYKTSDIPPAYFDSFVTSFNTVFERDFKLEYFKEKYESSYLGHSYHSLMIEEEQVVGACNFIPYIYNYFGEDIKLVLAVGVFIHPDHRENPLSLFKMYNLAKKQLKADGFEAVIAVPNDVAYQYWKSLVKWKDIGDIPYYILPLDIFRVLKLPFGLKILNTIGAKALLACNSAWSKVMNGSDTSSNIHIQRFDGLTEHRYIGDYKIVEQKKFTAYYSIVDEEGINTCYLIDFHNERKIRDLRSLVGSLQHIEKDENVDAIVYSGRMGFKQTCMLKVPKSKEPKRLPLCIGYFNKSRFEDDKVLDIQNWDFGLFNFDIR